jgi:hypothetical protein
MKKFKSIFTLAIIIALSATAAQAQTKVIALLTSASWCSICKANGERTFANFGKNNADGAFELVSNDISDKASKTKSKIGLQKAGIQKISDNYKAAGVITFIDAKTKKVISQVTVANSDEELTFVMSEARKAVK